MKFGSNELNHGPVCCIEKRESMEASNGTTGLKNGAGVWKAKHNSRNVSSVAGECRRDDAETTAKVGGNCERINSAAELNVAASTAPDPVASAEKSEQETMTKEVNVDAMLLRFLVGKGGSTKERIEKECKVQLKVPSTHEAKVSKSGCTVTGTAAGIEAARRKIKAILDEAVQSKLQYTHFISLPLATHPDLLEQVEKFQEQILARNQPSKATPSSGRNSGPSDRKKPEVAGKGKSALSGDEFKSKDSGTENLLVENQVKNSVPETLGAIEDKDVIMKEAGSLEGDTSLGEVKGSLSEEKNLDSGDGYKEERVESIKAEIVEVDKGLGGEEIVYETDVIDMEKGVVEVEMTPHKSGIDKSIFVKPRTFHLTVLMLKLWNEERVQQAAEVLKKTQAAVHEILEGRPVSLEFRGVETMRGKPDKAHVLYARVEDSTEKTRLLQACRVLIDAYVESGLVMETDIGQGLKLHATLMNTTHRTVRKNNRFGKRIPFNATEILEQYDEWRWGEFGIQEAHLSQRFVYGENGYYHCVRSIPLPSHSCA
ncbi:hypothetical protein R1flu_027018 [Riccia fluitans]|uniref:K Homology domain-containing protein n=1 Tax=Riccia fluitans TaxID=41844 RepID=A0ABD1XHP4_9MARC